MKRFSALYLAVLACFFFIVLSPGSRAAAGDQIAVRVFIIPDLSKKQTCYIAEGSSIITPIISTVDPENPNIFLFVYALKEGAAYTFHGAKDTGDTFSTLFYPVSGVDYVANVLDGTLAIFSGPAVSATPAPSSAAPDAASKKETVKLSDANAIVLADIGAPSPQGDPGEKVMFTLALAVNREYLPTEKYVLRNITIEPSIPTAKKDIESWPFEIESASYVRRLNDMSLGERSNAEFEFLISEAAAKGTYPIPFKLSATVWRYDSVNGTTVSEDVEFTLLQYVKVLKNGADSGKVTGIGALDIASEGAHGKAIPAPRCKNGERVRLRLPLVSRSSLTDVTVTPVLSANVDECPIVSEAVNSGQRLPDMKKGETVTLEYDFQISPMATKGNKPVKFRATYLENGAEGECTLTAYINVVSGYEKDSSARAGSATGLTIESYALTTGGERGDKLYAGDSAVLTLKIRNNATLSADRLRVRLSMDEKRLLLDTGQGDTQYVSAVAPDGEVSLSFGIRAPRDAAQGAAGMTVTMSCQGDSGAQTRETQILQIPVKQRVRVALDAPVISGDEYQPLLAGEPIPARCRVVNLGRAKIYNVRFDVIGDGLAMHEGYYGTDVPPLSDLFAGFKIVSGLPGKRDGKLVLSYEDEDGESYEQSAEFSVTVEERAASDRDATPAAGAAGNALPPVPVAGIIGAALFVSGLAALVYTRVKRGKSRRKRYL